MEEVDLGPPSSSSEQENTNAPGNLIASSGDDVSAPAMRNTVEKVKNSGKIDFIIHSKNVCLIISSFPRSKM